jgi:hypothetical protein
MVTSTKFEKPSLLFIITGLGKYTWWKIPFFKHTTYCTGILPILNMRIQRILGYTHGRCRCNKGSCKWITIFGIKIGSCRNGVFSHAKGGWG